MSVAIKPADVQTIAALARLGLSAAEVERATTDLSGILENFSEVQKIETSTVPTSDDVTGLSNIWREDVSRPDVLCTSQALLERAPATVDRQVKVKAVFKG